MCLVMMPPLLITFILLLLLIIIIIIIIITPLAQLLHTTANYQDSLVIQVKALIF